MDHKLVNMSLTSLLPLRDEDFSSNKRKPREKKPRQKFSLLYTIPVSVLNEAEVTNVGGRLKKGKRNGFQTYDALVCKSCDPDKFFHARDALRMHMSEEHEKGSTFSYSYSFYNRSRANKKTRSRRSTTVECIDLSDEEDSDDDDIEILDSEDSLNLDSLFISKDKTNEADESGYGSEIECIEERTDKTSDPIDVNTTNLQPKVLINKISIEDKAVTNEDDDIVDLLDSPVEKSKSTSEDKHVEVVLDEEVNAENNHIRNLLKEFDTPQNKRKQTFTESEPKKTRIEDEMLLSEDMLDVSNCLEVTINESEEKQTELIITDTFSVEPEFVDASKNPSNNEINDDDIIIC